MQAILVQPPFVQLNAPYPAIWYLDAFLRSRGVDSRPYDHSIEAWRALYSRKGLARVFADSRTALASGRLEPDGQARGEIERYLSYEPLYLEWIEDLVEFLSGAEPAFAHRLAAAAEFPRGARSAALLEASGGRIGAEDARPLATAILEDLADLIRFALDPDFGTVRYGDRLARSRGDLSEVMEGLSRSWFVDAVYGPLLNAFWPGLSAETAGRADSCVLVLITVPFPGCLVGALACARAARAALGSRATVVLGGGYVSTELRNLADPGLFDQVDYLSFDAGYGSLASILERLGAASGQGLWRTMRREGGAVVREGFGAGSAAGMDPAAREEGPWAALELEALETVFPDYKGADFTRYLRAVDSGNAMHRLWSDTPWLKYSLAHGCYWRRCAFCDTELDYVANFVPAHVEAVMEAAERAAREHALHGIHFVDEALPMAGLMAFGRANRGRAARGDRPFSFWGNVRFDASWTAGRSAWLAASGLVAVSGGIEIATERGLEMTNKGFDLPALVKTLVGMRRAGLLVHAYLIYGFPGQEPRDIVDSAEVVRQLFVSGLVDSAFWHRFVLTRHSRMMAERQAGRMPGLVPLDRAGSFADNDLEFEGEGAFDVFDAPLVSALDAWMKGEDLDRPAAEWFREAGIALPGSAQTGGAMRGARGTRGSAAGASVPPGLVEGLVATALEDLDAERPAPSAILRWLGGRPVLGMAASEGRRREGPRRLSWAWRGGMEELSLAPEMALSLAEALEKLMASPDGMTLADFLSASGLAIGAPRDREGVLDALLSAGLVAT